MRTLSEHVLDIVQNSMKAKATLIEIIVEEDKKNNLCSLNIKDNGYGMSDETLKQATNPFFTSRNTRKVGLGLPLLKQNTERSGGSFKLDSELGVGTKVEAVFQYTNIDKPPMGDIWETYYLILLSYTQGVLEYRHKTDRGEFSINSGELREMLGDVSIQQKEIREGITKND